MFLCEKNLQFFFNFIYMDISLLLKDEISVILMWIGIYGLLDQFIHIPSIYDKKNYIYALFVCISLFIKMP